MRGTAILLAVAMAASSISGAAGAQAPTRGGSDALAVTAVHNFARCAVDRTPDGARSLLAMDYEASDYDKAMKRFAKGHDYCAPGASLGFGHLVFAGALAERLLQLRPDRASLPQLLAYDGSAAPIQARSEPEMMALCIVRQQPAESAALLGTEPQSAEELQNLQLLAPTIKSCVKSGQTLRLNRPAIRALVALAAYRVVEQGGAAAAPAQGSN